MSSMTPDQKRVILDDEICTMTRTSVTLETITFCSVIGFSVGTSIHFDSIWIRILFKALDPRCFSEVSVYHNLVYRYTALMFTLVLIRRHVASGSLACRLCSQSGTVFLHSLIRGRQVQINRYVCIQTVFLSSETEPRKHLRVVSQ